MFITDEYLESLPPIIGTKEVSMVLGVNIETARKIINGENFPKLPIKKPIRVARDEFLRWAKLIN